jgi:hypothetical protein
MSPRSSRPPATLHRRSHVVSILCTCVRTMAVRQHCVSHAILRSKSNRVSSLSHLPFPNPFLLCSHILPRGRRRTKTGILSRGTPLGPSLGHQDVRAQGRPTHRKASSPRNAVGPPSPVHLYSRISDHLLLQSHCTETHLLTSKRLSRTCQLDRELHNITFHCHQLEDKRKKGEIRPVFKFINMRGCICAFSIYTRVRVYSRYS